MTILHEALLLNSTPYGSEINGKWFWRTYCTVI